MAPELTSGIADPRKRILVVDDEDLNRELLQILLEHQGYLVTNAENGKEALATVAVRAPDLILLDAMMPGLSGYEVAQQLKGNPLTKHIVILMVTAMDGPEARTRALAAGADGVLTKPISSTELCLRVSELLHLAPQSLV